MADRMPGNEHRPSKFAQYRALLAKDLRQEIRTREMLTSMVVYALLVLTVYGAALSQVGDRVQVVAFAGGMLWALIVFTSLLGLNRSFAHETESGCLEGILLAPVDRSVIFLAKATSNLVFLTVVELICVPLFFIFFLSGAELAPTTPMIVLPLVVGTVGVAGVGTLLSTMTIDTRGRDVLLAILLTGLGVSLTVNMKLVPNPGDGIVAAVAERMGRDQGFAKNIFDVGCVAFTCALGLLAAGRVVGIGVGTLAAMVGVGRSIALFNHLGKEKMCRAAGLLQPEPASCPEPPVEESL